MSCKIPNHAGYIEIALVFCGMLQLFSNLHRFMCHDFRPRRRTISETESQRGSLARTSVLSRASAPRVPTESANTRIKQLSEAKEAAVAKLAEVQVGQGSELIGW